MIKRLHLRQTMLGLLSLALVMSGILALQGPAQAGRSWAGAQVAAPAASTVLGAYAPDPSCKITGELIRVSAGSIKLLYDAPNCFQSTDGRYKLFMQTDGNMVLYDYSPSTHAIWWTGTYGTEDPSSGTSPKCNYEVDKGLYPTGDLTVWTSGITRTPQTYCHYRVQTDGNFVSYTSTCGKPTGCTLTPLWSWKTGLL